MGGKGVPGGDTLANFANSLIEEGSGVRRETQRRGNQALSKGRASRGAVPTLNQKLTEAFSAITQGLDQQRGQIAQAGAGRGTGAFNSLSNATREGFLEAGKVPTNFAQQLANQATSASFGSIPTIMSGFEARNQLGLSQQMGAFQNLGAAGSGVADAINQYAQLRTQRPPPPPQSPVDLTP